MAKLVAAPLTKAEVPGHIIGYPKADGYRILKTVMSGSNVGSSPAELLYNGGTYLQIGVTMRAIMEGRTEMRDVKVNTADLLAKVIANRVKHIEEYKEAVAGYKDAAKAEIKKVMLRLQARIDELEAGEMIRLASVHFELAVPENHEKDYDQAISMLDMSVDDEVTIKASEHACYVMDDWTWKQDFVNVSNMYKNR